MFSALFSCHRAATSPMRHAACPRCAYRSRFASRHFGQRRGGCHPRSFLSGSVTFDKNFSHSSTSRRRGGPCKGVRGQRASEAVPRVSRVWPPDDPQVDDRDEYRPDAPRAREGAAVTKKRIATEDDPDDPRRRLHAQSGVSSGRREHVQGVGGGFCGRLRCSWPVRFLSLSAGAAC